MPFIAPVGRTAISNCRFGYSDGAVMIYACNLIECRHDKFLNLGRGPMPNAVADVKCQITFISIFITESNPIEWKRIDLN